MNPFRRRRLRYRLSLLAMVALLWSQLVLAAHPGCLPMAESHAAPAMAETAGCDHDSPNRPEPVCQSHCDQGGLSNDVTRVPPVPPLPAVAALPFVALVAAPQRASLLPAAVAGPPPVSWHRPTAHPAALLLI